VRLDDLRCSFCEKGHKEVRCLVPAGGADPTGKRRELPNVYICDACVALCAEMIAEQGAEAEEAEARAKAPP
jgi:ATP-dependent Clp protease ATP-binding subunit ClpX